MTVTATPIFPQTINNSVAQIVNATGTGVVTLYTGGTNGSKVENIIATNTDSGAAYAITLLVVISATSYIIGTINVPASSGNTTAAPAVSLLNNANLPTAKDSNGNPYIYLANGAVLKAQSGTIVTSGKTISIFSNGGDY